MELVGAYLASLRGARDLTQQELAAEVGVSVRTIRNLESGRHEPKPTDLAVVLSSLRGSWIHVSQLLHSGATQALAQKLALDIVNGVTFTDEQRAVLENLTPDQKEILLAVARQMQQ